MAERKPSREREISDDDGCAYVLDEADGRRMCGAPRRQASSYCQRHHAVCYISSGTNAEAVRLREIEGARQRGGWASHSAAGRAVATVSKAAGTGC